jgi:hypothetical protein
MIKKSPQPWMAKKMVGLFHGKSQSKMDDEMGYTHDLGNMRIGFNPSPVRNSPVLGLIPGLSIPFQGFCICQALAPRVGCERTHLDDMIPLMPPCAL